MRRLLALTPVVLLGLSAGVAHGDSAPVNPPEPVEVSPAGAAPVEVKNREKEANRVCGSSAPAAAPATTIEPTVVSAPASDATAPAAPVSSAAPVATHLPDLNKPNPALLTRQTVSGYYVNTVRVLLPAGIKVTVRKDWYARDIVLVYPKNPYTNWRGVTPDACAFRHTGVVMEVVPSGTRYVPETLAIVVPSAVTVEVR